jgi:hypothetical protein
MTAMIQADNGLKPGALPRNLITTIKGLGPFSSEGNQASCGIVGMSGLML